MCASAATDLNQAAARGPATGSTEQVIKNIAEGCASIAATISARQEPSLTSLKALSASLKAIAGNPQAGAEIKATVKPCSDVVERLERAAQALQQPSSALLGGSPEKNRHTVNVWASIQRGRKLELETAMRKAEPVLNSVAEALAPVDLSAAAAGIRPPA